MITTKVLGALHLLVAVPLVWAIQPQALPPIPAPLRPLKFGEINFLHTTDTHGWHGGHLLEPSYGADWGDYIDFARHLRRQIEKDGNDLLIIDSGDRVEGNGLYDASQPKGEYTFPIFTKQRMDLLTTGNHELYEADASYRDHQILAPHYQSAYIISNIDILDPKAGEFVPLAKKYRKFTTKKQGIRIVSFGFVFDFNRNNNYTVVHPVEKVVEEDWFREVVNEKKVDLFVVVAHAAARSNELTAIFEAIRKVHPNIPIHFFGGHLHVRDYKKFDDKAYVLASGRFLETVGFASIDGIKGTGRRHSHDDINPGNEDSWDDAESSTDVTPSKESSVTFFRRYIDNNLYSYHAHSKTNSSTFSTDKGRKVSELITTSRQALGLDEFYGCSPTDLWQSRVPYPSDTSLYTWLNASVFPQAVTNPARTDRSRLVLCNSAAIRFDIFRGAFTKDWTYVISPFTSGMFYIADVEYAVALQIFDKLNSLNQVFVGVDRHGRTKTFNTTHLAPLEQRGRPDSRVNPSSSELNGDIDDGTVLRSHHRYRPNHIPNSHVEKDNQIPLSPSLHDKPTLELIPGHTTHDDAGTSGDDTIHTPIPFYRVPQVISSYIPYPSVRDDKVDLVFNQYLTPYVLWAAHELGVEYTEARDVGDYLDGETMTGAIARWIRTNWGSECLAPPSGVAPTAAVEESAGR